MKVSLNWLKEYIDIKLPIKELADRLTMAGLEVTRITPIGGRWDKVVVGQITEISPHPHADHLKLVSVDTSKERITVVSSAPNLRVGDKVPFAYIGAELIDPHTGKTFILSPTKIRGILSEGMVCSERELGISDRHEGVMVLPSDAPLGIPLSQYLSDIILDIDITPNRPDCLSVIGIAREIFALTGEPLHLPEITYPEEGPPIEEEVQVEIATPHLCPRYCAALIKGVKVEESPIWLKERLISYGMRPINNIVDITNYVMLEYGQPLHAFDFYTIKGKKIIVRTAKEGETLVTLDGIERTLSPNNLVIADAERAVAIAGVMGGMETEVSPQTKDILLESANFDFISIRRTSAQLKIRTEASIRFEKGLSPEIPPYGIRRAVQLILKLAGGKAYKGIIDIYPGKREKNPIPISVKETKRILGLELRMEEIKEVLTSLGFEIREITPSQIEVLPPYWRSDIKQTADIIEEVARIVGYEKIPITMPRGEIPQKKPNEILNLKERIRDILSGFGLQEVITYSLVSGEKLRKVRSPLGLKVINPLSKEQEYLRTSLRPGLLSTLALNQRNEAGLKIFEVGKVYLPREGLPEERDMVGCILSGQRTPISWLEKEEVMDFFDIKGLAQALLSALGIEADFLPSKDEFFLPLRQAGIFVKGESIGILGEIHPQILEGFEIKRTAYLLEMDLVKLIPFIPFRRYQPLPRFPSIIRDIALIVDEGIPSRRIEEIIRGFPLVVEVFPFDLYIGRPVPEGKKSLAYRITFQSPHRTLTDKEVGEVQEEILNRLKELIGAEVRH